MISRLDLAALSAATRFDFPLGNEHGVMAYNAQPFTESMHLGDGYRKDTRGWVNPNAFMHAHRGAAGEDVGRVT